MFLECGSECHTWCVGFLAGCGLQAMLPLFSFGVCGYVCLEMFASGSCLWCLVGAVSLQVFHVASCWPQMFKKFLESERTFPSRQLHHDLPAFLRRHSIDHNHLHVELRPWRLAWLCVSFRTQFDTHSSGQQTKPFMAAWEDPCLANFILHACVKGFASRLSCVQLGAAREEGRETQSRRKKERHGSGVWDRVDVFVWFVGVKSVSLTFHQHCSCTPAHVVFTLANAVTSALPQVFSKRVIQGIESQHSFNCGRSRCG